MDNGHLMENEALRTDIVRCKMDDGNYLMGVTCSYCYGVLKYKEICHLCFEDLSYWEPEEYQEHQEFIRHLVEVCFTSNETN